MNEPIGTLKAIEEILARNGSFEHAEKRLIEKMKPARLIPLAVTPQLIRGKNEVGHDVCSIC